MATDLALNSTETSCNYAPALVELFFNGTSPTNISGSFDNVSVGGYTFSGSIFDGSVSVMETNSTNIQVLGVPMYLVETITNDTWLYNITAASAGTLSFGSGSQLLEGL